MASREAFAIRARTRQVLVLVARGEPWDVIGRKTFVHLTTCKRDIRQLGARMGVSGTIPIVVEAIRRGILTFEEIDRDEA